ncbi:putative quinol monooxygenase [Limibacter armeniacum]|uniref:putative quinol monooxygenase n=1 Tax=Limibacter armeniacum TaxID=466084 RepID=UPI002FE50BDA
MKVYLTAIIKAKPEHREEVLQVLNTMVEHSRKEAACLQYDLHQGTDDENMFVFYEIWQDQQGLDQHNQRPYIKAFASIIDEKLAEQPIIHKTKIL